MARAVPSRYTFVEGGVAAVYTTPTSDGDTILGDAKTVVHVFNDSVSPITVTVATGATLGGYALADDVVTVAAGVNKFIGPFTKGVFNQTSGGDVGKVYVNYSAQTDVTRAVLTW